MREGICKHRHQRDRKGLTESELTTAIRNARLGHTDAQIAIGRLVCRMCWVDIGAAVNMDRTTAMRRMKNIIIPRLVDLVVERNQGNQKKVQTTKVGA